MKRCPICKGAGEIPEPQCRHQVSAVDKAAVAKLLRKEGYSFREIMRFMGYKSPRSIQKLVNNI